ncbi:hypothetical protein AB6A40_009935 [Gnathostoma spinigerum]|uniref:Uncharacterized protein n=1 Tax=Gnathostoma spinigerum TaxID=75299 RepID=A0ABD6ETP8_9BILA
MSDNLSLYYFDGSVQRDRLQDAVFRDMSKREGFLRKVRSEREERQLLSKKTNAAIKIQSSYRSYITRKKYHEHLRATFDAVGPSSSNDVLALQVARLNFFFKPDRDQMRMLSICDDAVRLFALEESIRLPRIRVRQLYRCVCSGLLEIDITKSFSNVLRFITLYLTSDDCEFLVNCAYFNSIIFIFAQRIPLPQREFSTFILLLY